MRFLAVAELGVPGLDAGVTFHDTAAGSLAAGGASLRSSADGWVLALGSREVRRRAAPQVPAELLELVAGLRRGAELRPVRTVHRVKAQAGGVPATLTDQPPDAPGKPRIVEVTGEPAEVDRIAALLLAAGAVPEPAAGPAPALDADARAGDVVAAGLRAGVERILRHDPFARLRENLPNGNTPVHQMRVGTRRLRSDLQTFGPLLDAGWAAPLRSELSWLAAALGGARDAEVLRARLHVTAAADPLAPLDPAALDRIEAALTGRHDAALETLERALLAPRYLTLLDTLVAAARAPRLTATARKRAADVLPAIVRRPWRRLLHGGGIAPGAGDLTPGLPDDAWHEVRKRAKRARYAADVVAPVIGPHAALLAKRIGKAQKVLGEHQDAAIAADTWLFVARFLDRADHGLSVTAGRLHERERAAVTRARAAFPPVWQAVLEGNSTAWLT